LGSWRDESRRDGTYFLEASTMSRSLVRTLFFSSLLTLGCLAAAVQAQLASGSDASSAAGQSLRRTPVVEVFQTCKDAVVNISSTQIIEQRTGLDLFGGLFDMELPGPVRRQAVTSVGSGFVIHSSGYIVTNAHVIARTTERKAIFPDKREYDAEVIAVDHEHDLAVLKIKPQSPLKPLRLGRSADLMVGETVIAIGNPLGLQHTCTAGVVSALDRELAVNENLVFRGLVQTDASINPGNSGGPLLNILGELIAINTAIRGDAQNIGFAIPVDQLRTLLPDMLSVERRNRMTVGMRVSIDGQARIVSLDKGGPGDRAGLQLNDVLTTVDNEPVTNGLDFYIDLINHKPGDAVPVRFSRSGVVYETKLVIGSRPKPDGVALLRDRLGLTVQPLSDKGSRAMLMRPGTGLVVTKVEEDGAAAKGGVERGDVLLQIGRFPANSLDEVGELLESVTPGQGLLLTIRRLSGRQIQQGTLQLQVR
jgi:serine protease Do